MKVLFYINVLGGGGAERVLVNLANNFAECGDSVLVVATFGVENEYELIEGVRKEYLEIAPLTCNKIKKNFRRIRSLRRIIREYNPDVAISFMAEPNVRLIFATAGLNVRKIISVRNDPKREYPGNIGKIISHIILPMADGCVFQTDEAKAYFPYTLRKKSKVIANAVKEEFFNVNRTPLENRVVTLGRLTEQKNHKLLINAFRNVLYSIPNAHLEIYGVGDLHQELKLFIEQSNLDSSITLMGSTDNVKEVLSKATVFVLSSDYEGMPNALLEAFVSGVPCVSTDCPCGGPRMLIKNGVNGYLVTVNNEIALSKAICNLLSNKELQEQFSRNAIYESQKYSSQLVFEEWREYAERIAYYNR